MTQVTDMCYVTGVPGVAMPVMPFMLLLFDMLYMEKHGTTRAAEIFTALVTVCLWGCSSLHAPIASLGVVCVGLVVLVVTFGGGSLCDVVVGPCCCCWHQHQLVVA